MYDPNDYFWCILPLIKADVILDIVKQKSNYIQLKSTFTVTNYDRQFPVPYDAP